MMNQSGPRDRSSSVCRSHALLIAGMLALALLALVGGRIAAPVAEAAPRLAAGSNADACVDSLDHDLDEISAGPQHEAAAQKVRQACAAIGAGYPGGRL